MPLPQYVRRDYGGGAVVAQLVNSIGATDTSFAITPTTGWTDESGAALGTNGPFTICIDRFSASVEKILCSAINLSTGVITVYVAVDGTSGRGYDGSTAQGHVPGTTTAGVQTVWTSVEANEANQAVYDLLGGGGVSTGFMPIGALIDFGGSALTVPTNWHVADASAVSRATYSALFTAITIPTTGVTTGGSAVINSVSSSVTPYVAAGQQVTLTNSGGAVYTVASVASTSITLTSGTGVTAGTGNIIVYPHGAGDGSTTFNLPDSRGRGTVGAGAVGTNTQPTLITGQNGGQQSLTISSANLPSHQHGLTAAGTNTVNVAHTHSFPSTNIATVTANSQNLVINGSGVAVNGIIGLTTDQGSNANTGQAYPTHSHSLTGSTDSTGSGSALNVESPYLVATKIIRVS